MSAELTASDPNMKGDDPQPVSTQREGGSDAAFRKPIGQRDVALRPFEARSEQDSPTARTGFGRSQNKCGGLPLT